MTKAQHTPGPWGLMYPDNPFDGFVAGPDDKLVAIGMGDDTRANARLISAAPDLLEALENTCFAIESAIMLQGLSELIPYADNARKAIAKAKGIEE